MENFLEALLHLIVVIIFFLFVAGVIALFIWLIGFVIIKLLPFIVSVSLNPSLKADLADLRKRNAEYKKRMEWYCKRNPTHILCEDVVENWQGRRTGSPMRINRANAIIDYDGKGNRTVTLKK